jgi:hypothetical protein
MPKFVKGLLIALVAPALATLMFMLFSAVTGGALAVGAAALIGAILGFAYGLQAGILVIYDLSTPKGWGQLVLDMTWSLPNTLFGFLVGNAIYPFFGWPTRATSEGTGWIVYMPRSAGTGFGHDVLQTLGTINLGGSGNHERVHLLQARIFGPLYLPLFGANYVVNFLVQGLWTVTVGGLLSLLKLRDKAYFRPPGRSAVSGFFGWIYFATLFELWAYRTEH